MRPEEFFDHIHPILSAPALEAWDYVREHCQADMRDRLEELEAIGQPAVCIGLDTSWRVEGPARVVIVVPPARVGDEDEIAEIARTEISEDYRRALLDFCRVALGDLDKREGDIHAAHQAGTSALTFLVDVRRQSLRLVASLDGGRNIALVEVLPPARSEPAVLH